MERVIPEFIWVMGLLFELPRLIWWGFGCLLPSDWAKYFVWNTKPLEKRLRPLEKVGKLTNPTMGNIHFASDFFIVGEGVRDVPRREASAIVYNSKLDPFDRYRYSKASQQSPNEPDLIEIALSHDECEAPLTLFINNQLGHNEEFTEFEPEDRVTVFLQEGVPIFIYNHHTHVLVNCDFYDLVILKKQGVMLRKKGKALTQRVQDAVMLMRSENVATNTGKKPPRAHLLFHSFDEPPPVLIDFKRDIYKILFMVAYACFAFYVIVSVIMALLHK